MKKINKAKIMKLIALITTIAILVIATIYMIPIIKQINTPEGQAQFKEKITNSGITGMLILFGLELAQVVLAILPGEPVELLAGICFGPIWGTIFLMVSVFIVTAMIYFFVKKYGRDFIYEFFPKEKVNKVENSKLFKDPQKVETVMALLFLIPGTPKDLLVYIGGLLPIKTSRFLALSTLLRFPSIISSTIAGDKLLEGQWKVSILAYVITFAITAIVIFVVNKFDKNKVTEDVIKTIKNKEM
ncbi:MAG: TVP38/TMEM64 family protein [Clostridia bacterium]|jgi:hypothetical protein|nr:sNARE-like domain protein [Clostridium sp. CAG:389]